MNNISKTYHIRLHGMFHESVLVLSGNTPYATVSKEAEKWQEKYAPYRDVVIVKVEETLIKTI